MQHLSRILFAKLFLFFFPFFSLPSSIFLALISRIRSKNTWKDYEVYISVKSIETRRPLRSVPCNKIAVKPVFCKAYLIDVGTSFGRSLDVADCPLICSGFGLLQPNLSSVFQVWLISHQQERYVFFLLHTKDLFSEVWKKLTLIMACYLHIYQVFTISRISTWNQQWQRKILILWWRTHRGIPLHCGNNCLEWQRSPLARLCQGCRSGPPLHPEPPFFCSCQL